MRASSLSLGLAALVGVALLTAGSALLVAALTRSASDPSLAAPATIQVAAPSGTIIAQPDVICRHCTEVPLPTVTAVRVGVTATSTLPPSSPQPPSPVRLTRTPATALTASATRTFIGTPRPPTTTLTPTLRPPTGTPTATASTPMASAVASSTAIPPAQTPTPSRSPTATRVPPIPPAAQLSAQLWMLSEFDPDQQVRRSATNAITWPGGEVLHVAPAITLTLPDSPDPAYRYRGRVTAWSFVSSHGVLATARDSMGQVGCRLRSQPARRDADGLAGCAYRYLSTPTVEDMYLQAHAFWSVGTPLEMCMDIYVYDLGQLRTTDLVLQARVLTEVVAVATGQVVSDHAAIVTLPFAVTLAVPRSAQ